LRQDGLFAASGRINLQNTGIGGIDLFDAGGGISITEVGSGATGSTGDARITILNNTTGASGSGIFIGSGDVTGATASFVNTSIKDGRGILLDAGNGDDTLVLGSGAVLTDNSDGGIEMDANGARGIYLYSPGGGGITIQDTGNPGFGIDMETVASSANIFLRANAGAGIALVNSNGGTGTGNIQISQENDSGITVQDTGSGGIGLFSSGHSFGYGIDLEATAGKILLNSYGATGGIEITQNNDGATGQTGHVFITNNGTGPIQIKSATGSGDIIIDMTNASGYIRMTGLPTSSPGGSGRVWNNAGVLNIT
jgi:hypothetical protein